ncbi:hypothetical protein ACXO9E_06210 [Lactobacillus delbrueckii subsp. bulgaricus]
MKKMYMMQEIIAKKADHVGDWRWDRRIFAIKEHAGKFCLGYDQDHAEYGGPEEADVFRDDGLLLADVADFFFKKKVETEG